MVEAEGVGEVLLKIKIILRLAGRRIQVYQRLDTEGRYFSNFWMFLCCVGEKYMSTPRMEAEGQSYSKFKMFPC